MVRSFLKTVFSNSTLKNGLCLLGGYFLLLVVYIMLQEFYIMNCTYRGGLMNLFVSMPMCVYTNKAMEFLGNQFMTAVILFSVFVFNMITNFINKK